MRRFLWFLVALAASTVLAAQAQDLRSVPLVAVFMGGNAADHGPYYEAFRRGMSEAGWRDGDSVRYEVRWANNRLEDFAPLAEELVRLHPALILATTSPGAVAVARAAQGRIPIVTVSDDPVALGLAQNHARPGGNITGTAPMFRELSLKQLELLQRIRPGAKRLGILVNPDDEVTMRRFTAAEAEMRAMTQLVVAEARNAGEIPAAFRQLARDGAEGVVVPLNVLVIAQRAAIARLATENRIPAVFPMREAVEEGGLISYGINLKGQHVQAVHLADRILRGTSPAVLPIEFIREFEIAVNLQTARVLGITIPEDIQLRATSVIR